MISEILAARINDVCFLLEGIDHEYRKDQWARGMLGRHLGGSWREAGNLVTFGVRNPEDAKYARLRETEACAGVRDAAREAEVVVLATPWPATQAAIEEAGGLEGKIVIDCINPLKADLSGLELGLDTSAGEKVQAWAKGAKVVKAFNTIGAGNMTPAAKYAVKPVMFICGNDAGAKQTVLALTEQLGLDGRDAGGIEVSRLLEPIALLLD